MSGAASSWRRDTTCLTLCADGGQQLPSLFFQTSLHRRESGVRGRTAPFRAHTLQPGSLCGSFRVLARLGEGAMGIVFLAENLPMRRVVALKILQAGPDDATSLRRFQDEIRLMARVRSDHVAHVFGSGWLDGAPFCEMEYVPGHPLRTSMRRGPIDPIRAARLVRGAARGLADVHEAGVVHGDVKPENLLVRSGADGADRPVLVDFGLSHPLDEQVACQEGSFCGTPLFMAPECWELQGPPPDERADLYALGAVLYELLAGRPHLVVESFNELVAKASRSEFDPPARHQPAVPPELDRVCMKLLARDPGRRYASARELEADLQRFLVERRFRSAIETIDGGLRRERRHVHRLALLAAALTLLLGLALGWLLRGAIGPSDRVSPTRSTIRTDRTALCFPDHAPRRGDSQLDG